jgi:hypothetical protein
MKLLEITNVDFDVIDQRLIKLSISGTYRLKKGSIMVQYINFFIDFKEVYNSVRREVLYNILIEFGTPMKQVVLIKTYLNETYSTVRIGKYQSDSFPIQNGLKQEDALSPLLYTFTLEYAIKTIQGSQKGLKLNGTH